MFNKRTQVRIFDIKRDCSDDGPGIRTTIFFQGCPLHCLWCHNPEGIPFNKGGVSLSVRDLSNRVLIDEPYFSFSGGGVTLSGGEATIQMDGASHFLKILKENKIHTILETSGCFNIGHFEKKMLPYLDLILYDIKLFSSHESSKYIGKVYEKKIKSNLEILSSQYPGKINIRLPLIPMYTTTKENLKSWALFLNNSNIKTCELLPFNPLMKSTIKNPRNNHNEHHKYFSQNDMIHYKNYFASYFLGHAHLH